MSDNRHPAGTSLGGQWAPGSSSEIDLDDALDETPTGWDLTEPEPEPEYPIADDGGFDFNMEGAGPREERFLHVREPRNLDLHPGDVAVVESKSGRDSFVMAGSRGIAVLEPADEGGYELLSMAPRNPGSPSSVALGADGVKSVSYDDWYIESEEEVMAGDVEEHSGLPRNGKEAKKLMLARARTDVVGSLTSSGERQWCESRQAGPEFASHPLAREKAYDLVSSRPDLDIRPSLSDDEYREWDEFDGLDPQHYPQVFAHRRVSPNAEEHYFADGDSIFAYRHPENETERIA